MLIEDDTTQSIISTLIYAICKVPTFREAAHLEVTESMKTSVKGLEV